MLPMSVSDLQMLMRCIHESYCAHTECDRDAAFFWLRSFVTLVGTASFFVQWPKPVTLQQLLQSSSHQQHDALFFRTEVHETLLEQKHFTEWLLKAGEIRLLLHSEWGGEWEELNIMHACSMYETILRESYLSETVGPIVLSLK